MHISAAMCAGAADAASTLERCQHAALLGRVHVGRSRLCQHVATTKSLRPMPGGTVVLMLMFRRMSGTRPAALSARGKRGAGAASERAADAAGGELPSLNGRHHVRHRIRGWYAAIAASKPARRHCSASDVQTSVMLLAMTGCAIAPDAFSCTIWTMLIASRLQSGLMQADSALLR